MTLARLMAGVALIGLMASPALAQNQDQTQQQQPAGQSQQQLAQQDMEFAKKAAGGGMAEVKLGQLAQDKAKNDQVKQFGQRMVDDHSKANDKLKTIAQQKNIDLPQDLPEDAQQTYDELQNKSGQEFDQAYMDHMVKDHKKDIDLFQKEAQSGQDQDLKQFAEQTLPTLQEHLDLAQQTQKQVTASADQGQTGNQTGTQTQASDQTATPAVTAPAAGQAANEPSNGQQPTTTGSNDQQQAATGSDTTQQPAMAPSTGQQAATEPGTEQPAATAPATTEQPAATEPTNEQQQAATQPAAPQVKAEDVIGTKVVNNKGEQVGEVEDLVIDKDKVQYAVISVGGFLGIGEKHVVVPIEQLKLGKDQIYLTTAQTEDQLKQLPEYKEDQYQSQKQG